MKWLGSRLGAALDDWQGALFMGLLIGLSGLIFYADSLREAFLWGVGAALVYVLTNILFGVIRRKPQTRR